MNNADREYFRLVTQVLEKGRLKGNRTGTNTLGVFGAQARFNLEEGFPLLTTKKVFFKGIVHELLWFLSGDTNIKYLVDNNVRIWNKDAHRKYTQICKANPNDFKEWMKDDGSTLSLYNEIEFSEKLKENDFARIWGELGEGTYGGMWRGFPTYFEGSEVDIPFCARIDQIRKVINTLKTNPDDRRMIVSAWHPYWVDHCTLPPCHVLFQFQTEELTADERQAILHSTPGHKVHYYNGMPEEDKHKDLDACRIPRRRLNLQLYQRSCDLFLGVPFNIASYALLLQMVAQVTNMQAGEFIHTYGDLHLYVDHLDLVREQLIREPLNLPKVSLNPKITDILDFKFDDVKLEGYEAHPPIKGEMST